MLHLVGCLYYCNSDAWSHKHQKNVRGFEIRRQKSSHINSINKMLTLMQWVNKYALVQSPTCFDRLYDLHQNAITTILTYSTVQSPAGEANWFAASQEIPRISRNPKVHYRTHKRPPPVSILGQPYPIHIPTSHLLQIRPNIIHPAKLHFITILVQHPDDDRCTRLTLNPLKWRIWWASNNASRWQMGFHSAFKGLMTHVKVRFCNYNQHDATIFGLFYTFRLVPPPVIRSP